MRKREMSGDGQNQREIQRLKRILCGSKVAIPETAGTISKFAGKNRDTRSSAPNQASLTPGFSYPLMSSK